MATATMATAAGAAALLYYTFNRRSVTCETDDLEMDKDRKVNGNHINSGNKLVRKNTIVSRPAQAPGTWLETISTLAETLRFTYSETLGKWPIGDLAFGINFLLRKQGHLHVASVYAGGDSKELTGPAIISELKEYLNLLTMCIHFSKKPFPLFLEATGYSSEAVLLQEPKAGLLKPAFTILVDQSSCSFLLLIRGTHSIKDTLTAATGAIVPFHHTVLDEGGVSNLVLGYAHCGMVAAARWIARLATPCLQGALKSYPEYKIKVVGHSLGGGTAALLTYVLRECKEFSSTHCISFAPAACMTWDLAESGTPFITSVINGSDLVPTFSSISVDDLRAEVTASAWINDFREQIERTKFLSTVYRSASALGARLPSIANAKARVARAGSIWRPVSNGTQVVIRQAQSMAQAVVRTRPSLGLSGWSCMGPRRRPSAGPVDQSETLVAESTGHNRLHSTDTQDIKASESTTSSSSDAEVRLESSWSIERDKVYRDNEIEEEEELLVNDSIINNSGGEDMNEDFLWHQIEQELNRKATVDGHQLEEEEAAAAQEIIEEEENAVASTAEITGHSRTELEHALSDSSDSHRFYPPGRILHIVSNLPSDSIAQGSEDENTKIGIYVTPRELYGKLRLSRTMINDHYMPIYKRVIEQLLVDLEQVHKNDSEEYESEKDI